MSNDDAKEMAKLLQQGASMLDSYCPNCGKILFKLPSGQIFCPICKKEVRIIKNQRTPTSFKENIGKSFLISNKNDSNQTNLNTRLFANNDIKSQLSNQILKMLQKLDNINDIGLYNKVLESIDLLLRIFEKIRILNQ